MFKLFRNKNGKIKIIDRVFIHRQGKWNHCQKLLAENPRTIFIGWFDDSISELEKLFARITSSSVLILNAKTTHKAQVEGSAIIFIEHHPLKSKEDMVFDMLGLKEAIVLSALDEPWLTIFGSEKIIGMMQNLGMKEDEIIEHKMVSQSIVNAQKKIEEKMIVEQSVRSQAEWIERNFKITGK